MLDQLYMDRDSKNIIIENIRKEIKKETDIEEDIKDEALSSFPCLPCNVIYRTARQHRDHTTYKHGTAAKCDSCDKIFASQKKCSQHVFNKHGDKRFWCTQCGAEFVKSFSLRKHKKSCGKRKRVDFSNHKCESCQKYFNKKFQ